MCPTTWATCEFSSVRVEPLDRHLGMLAEGVVAVESPTRGLDPHQLLVLDRARRSISRRTRGISGPPGGTSSLNVRARAWHWVRRVWQRPGCLRSHRWQYSTRF